MLTKLVFTILAVIVVWYGFKWVARMQEMRDHIAKGGLSAGGPGAEKASKETNGPDKDIEDMVKCKVCDSFVAANNAVSCGREDCPYPG